MRERERDRQTDREEAMPETQMTTDRQRVRVRERKRQTDRQTDREEAMPETQMTTDAQKTKTKQKGGSRFDIISSKHVEHYFERYADL